jgi:formamidopyrimidine-DNA glycosylase
MAPVPELPEVETMRRGAAPAVGSRILRASRPPSTLRSIRFSPAWPALRRRLKGRRIEALERVGKRVVVVLDGDERLVFEPRMTGLVLLADPPDESHLRLRLDLAGGPASTLLFWDRRGLGTVSLLGPRAFARECGPPKLGPDALDLTPGLLRERLGQSRREVKVGLLDQAAIAGIGNIYASEALHLARVHPATPCLALTPPRWRRLCEALLEVLRLAIQNEGSDLGDGTYQSALRDRANYQNMHRVYGCEGERCGTCGRGWIRRTVQAQRATFHCPVCQRLPRRPGAG